MLEALRYKSKVRCFRYSQIQGAPTLQGERAVEEKMTDLLIYTTSTKNTTVIWQLHIFSSEEGPCVQSLLKN